jgi:L-ribulose-5-phosphate 4-epimerase
MLEELKESVLEANLELIRKGLIKYTWGNVSGIDENREIVAIKPSGISYEDMTASDMVLVDRHGHVVEGKLNPSSDTPTHLELYKSFESVGGICHTHSPWATIYAQAGESIPPFGTTHADYFCGSVPCTRELTKKEINGAYEKNTGLVIIETFNDLNPAHIPAVVVKSHAPFTWGKDPAESVYHAVVLEEVARMGWLLQMGSPRTLHIPQVLLEKHFLRKHGANAYYGQS